MEVWNVKTSKCENTLLGHRGSVLALATFDKCLYSGSRDKSIKVKKSTKVKPNFFRFGMWILGIAVVLLLGTKLIYCH